MDPIALVATISGFTEGLGAVDGAGDGEIPRGMLMMLLTSVEDAEDPVAQPRSSPAPPASKSSDPGLSAATSATGRKGRAGGIGIGLTLTLKNLPF